MEKFGEEGKKKRWPEAFVHVGHLEINGKKMAKSLKNFTSVDDFLEGGKTGEGVEGGLAGTAVEFRMFCLLNHYRKNVEISQGKMKFARKTCSVFSSFLKNARVQLASDGFSFLFVVVSDVSFFLLLSSESYPFLKQKSYSPNIQTKIHK